MITNNSIIEGKKPLGLMLLPQLKTKGILEAFPCVRNAPCITQDLAVSSVRLVTRALQKLVPKSKQQCLRKSILAEGQECSPRSERSHGKLIQTQVVSKLVGNSNKKNTIGKMAEQDIPPPTITAMKIPIIRKGEYNIWSMRMRQYICHIDHNLWDLLGIRKELEHLGLARLMNNHLHYHNVADANHIGSNQIKVGDLEVKFKGKDLMMTLAGAMHQQMNHHRQGTRVAQEVLENGNSFKPTAKTTTNADGTSTTLIPGPVTTEEKVQKKNDMKARSMLLMALPNEHLMTFNQYKDVKTLFAAIQTIFGGNEATKKTQKTLLKQMYENFSALSTESLDSIFNRLQKIVSQLAILGEHISQEDLNLKFLRSRPSEWNTHVVVWRNKPDPDTMSFDDIYNNFKIVEQEVKGTESSSLSLNSQNMDFMLSPSSTNEVNTAYGVSTANTQVIPASIQVSIASTQVSTANLSDDTVYAFLASQPNGSQLVYEDLEQIHKDDIEEMDLKWQLALLSMRTRRGPRNQDNRIMNQDNSRRTVNVEEISSKAMLAIDGAGFDWSYMADDEVPTNMALMAFSDSEIHNDKTCSKTCLKSFETLKTQLDDLRIEFNKSEFNLANYKRRLAYVEEQLVFYKKNEVIFYEQLAVLKTDISYKDSEISMLKSELEKLKQKKESNQLKIKNFDNAYKSLDILIGSQIPDKSRKGLGGVQQPEFEGYGPKTSKSISEDISNEVMESPDAPLVKELVSDDKLEKKTIFPTVAKIYFVRAKQQENPVRKPVKYAEMYSFDHVQANCNYHQRERVVSGNNYTMVNYNYSTKQAHPSAYRNMAARVVLIKTGLRPLNTVRPVNTAHFKTTVYSAKPMSCFSKSAQSTVKRLYQIKAALTNKNFSQKVNTAKGSFYTARPKVVNTASPKAVNTARPNSAVVNAVRANQGHLQKEDQVCVDSGCSWHMTCNMSYLSDFKEFDRGYVTFRGGQYETKGIDGSLYKTA
ncbi:hypothetical protein Tco_0845560 [Tanacetum coccineum]